MQISKASKAFAVVSFATLIACSEVGPKGDPGASGTPGVPGAPGTKGDHGAQGQPGSPGEAGPSGQQGVAGEAGPPGPSGPQGEAGPAGAPGDAGPSGPPGEAGSPGITGFVWKDAVGAQVRVVFPTSWAPPSLFVADSLNYVWRVSSISGVIVPARDDLDGANAMTFKYTSTDCSGTAYVSVEEVAYPAGFTFRVTGDARYRALSPTTVPASIQQRSFLGGSGCSTSSATSIWAVPESTTLPSAAITKPASLLTPPVHAEYAQ